MEPIEGRGERGGGDSGAAAGSTPGATSGNRTERQRRHVRGRLGGARKRADDQKNRQP